jgi:hypothetical protein
MHFVRIKGRKSNFRVLSIFKTNDQKMLSKEIRHLIIMNLEVLKKIMIRKLPHKRIFRTLF